MHIGHFLIMLGVAAVVGFVALTGYIIASRKKSKLYKTIIKQETTKFEAFNATVQTMREQTHASLQIQEASTANTVLENTVLENTFLHDETILEEFDLPVIVPPERTGEIHKTAPYMPNPVPGLDWSPLNGYYEFLSEIKGGGMGRIFKARKTNTGNEWIVKFIPTDIGKISSETDILKSLNHVSLPAVIDVFENDSGQFLVQSFIEGVGMDQAIKARPDNDRAMPVFKVIDWAIQMGQVLNYLHHLDEPLLHLDLKPSNIMVTHADKLVLIDFGISRKQSDVVGAVGATLSYAAPEQLKRTPKDPRQQEIIERRFGTLPEDRKNWDLDTRTDIYSLGVILYEAATGHVPQLQFMKNLQNHVPSGFARIIYKCLEINPKDRYQSITEFLADMEIARKAAHRVQFSLLTRKVAQAASVACVAIAAFGFIMGTQIIELEAATVMDVDPNILTVSLMQSSYVRLYRFLPDTGAERPLNENNINWDITANHIAQIDGNRIIGLNIGDTTIYGTYRNNQISMQVHVVEPMHGMVDIVQRYNIGGVVSLLAGTTYRQRTDGSITTAEFVSPQSMDISDQGAIYIADAGVLRRLYNNYVYTITINPAFLTPSMVRTYGNDIFVLTDAWYEDGGFYYGIIRITAAGAEGFFLGDAIHTYIRDFFVHDGLIYKLEHNAGMGNTYLRTISLQNPADINTITELPYTTSAMVYAGERIFFANSQAGTIFKFANGTITHIAGIYGERHFLDGPAPLFYQPQRLQYINGDLYIWDFNVLRKLILENGIALEAVSVAGSVSTVYDMAIHEREGYAYQIILPYSQLTDFLYIDGSIIITDPKRGVVWEYS